MRRVLRLLSADRRDRKERDKRERQRAATCLGL